MNNRKGMIGLTLAVIMVASVFSVLPVALAQPPTPTEGDNPIINVNASGITASLRVYGEYDEGPVSWMGGDRSQFIYRNWSDPFDPTALKKDSLTFNPAIILDGEYGQMSAGPYSNDIHVKKFLRLWYEPEHVYSKPTYKHPTIEVESTYMLIDAQDCIPTKGKANVTYFVFPIAEIPGQTGLGAFENTQGTPNRENRTSLVLVSGDTELYGKTTNGTIRLQKTYDLAPGDTIQFLDHKLRYEYVVTRNGQEYAKVTMWYAGNIEDDTKVRLLLGQYDDGTPDDPDGITWFKRHNERYGEPDHANHVTWYAKFENSGPGAKASITVGKEISAGDTFYVNAVRYDVPAVEVIDTDGDYEADAFKYITLRTPLPKAPTSILVPDDGKVSSQWIDTIAPREVIPLNPPFNTNHTMVDDINVVLWEPTAHTDEWPIGDPSGTIGKDYFPWAERYLTMQREEIEKEMHNTTGGNNIPAGQNWLNYFNVQMINKDGDGNGIAYDIDERLLDVGELRFCYFIEDDEPRYTTDLLEELHEEFPDPQTAPPVESWTELDIKTKPDEFTEFALPKLPDVETPYWNKTGDYLLVSSFLAPNSINRSDINRTIPRMAFAHDVIPEKDVMNTSILMGNGLDLYVNRYTNVSSSIRIYGEDDIGPIRGYGPRGIYRYERYQEPFDPAAIRKDSITFNPAIVQWDGDEYPMSAYNPRKPVHSNDIDVKKYLRMWYEPEHRYSKNIEWGDDKNYTYPTIEVESTYLMIDSQDKLPISGEANGTFFVFPIAENTSTAQHGLELFENPNSRPNRKNVVTLAYVNGTVGDWNKTTNGTIRIQKTYRLSIGESVRFLDHKLEYKGILGTGQASVDVWYGGNTYDDALNSSIGLGTPTNPNAITWFDRHNNKYGAPSHPAVKWYAKLENYFLPYNDSLITVGMELQAGDVFYVDGVRYDVAAIEVIDGDGNGANGAELFKYITLRTPLPKKDGISVTTDTVADDGIMSSQEIVTIPPNTNIPLDPPFNMEHYIVDDIDVNGTGFEDVETRIIGPYDPLEVKYLTEVIEPRYSTNLLEILDENVTGDAPIVEDWTKYDVITRPDQYTEFVLPGDSARYNFTANRWRTPLHNDYLITTSFLANNSINKSDLVDPVHDIPRAAFVFDAINLEGIYVNEIVGAPPSPPAGVPKVFCNVTPTGDVPSGTLITACVSATHFVWPLYVEVDWGDGSPVSTGVLTSNTSTFCPTHTYLRKGNWTINQTATDIYGNTGYNISYVNVTSDGFRLCIGPGWNQFSIPVNDTITVNDIFDPPNNTWFSGVWRWNESTQDWEFLVGSERLYPKYGYFVYGPPSGTVCFVINGTAEAFDNSWWAAYSGKWIMVGPGYWPQSIPQWGYWWDSGTWSYQETHNLVPGRGYWVKP